MKRWLYNVMVWTRRLLAAGSLLLLVVTVVFWIRSENGIVEEYLASPRNPDFGLCSQQGQIGIYWNDPDSTPSFNIDHRNLFIGNLDRIFSDRPMPGKPVGTLAHFFFYADSWFLCLVFGILPAIYIGAFLRLRLRKRKVGDCTKCGYDLRATPERCPECGTVPVRSKAGGATTISKG